MDADEETIKKNLRKMGSTNEAYSLELLVKDRRTVAELV